MHQLKRVIYRWKLGQNYWIPSAPVASLNWNSCIKSRFSATRIQSWWRYFQKLWGLYMTWTCLQKIPFFTGFAREQILRAGNFRTTLFHFHNSMSNIKIKKLFCVNELNWFTFSIGPLFPYMSAIRISEYCAES